MKHASAPVQTEPRPTERRQNLLPVLLCLVSVAMLYAPALQFDFVGFDDTAYVLRHDWVRQGITWQSLVTAFTSDGGIYWHPLTWVSHLLDVSLFGLSAGPHHLQNIVWHAASAVLLYLVARGCGFGLLPSLACALLWALHPLRVESVAWVAGRKDVLSGFFWLLAVWLYLRHAAASTPRRYLAMLAAALAGYLSKPTMVTLPFLFLLLDFWPLRRPWSIRLLWEKVPLFALSVAVSGATYLSQKQAGALSMVEGTTLWERTQNALLAYVWYLSKTFWPVDLAVLYPYPREIGLGAWLAAGTLLLALSAAAVLLRHRFPALVPGWFGFLGILVPMIGLVQAGPQPYADRFTYIASIPLTLGLVAVASLPFEGTNAKRNRPRPALLAGIALVLVLSLALRSASQISTWRDGETVFAHATAAVPGNAIAAANLGALRIARGAWAEALAPLESAVRDLPNYALARHNLGVTLTQLQQLPRAERELRRATALDPNRAETWLALGVAQWRLQRIPVAIASYQHALALGLPAAARAQAHTDLGIAYLTTGKADVAGEQFRLALEADPGNERALINRAVFLHSRGESREALSLARRAYARNPANAQAKGMVEALERRLADSASPGGR